MIVIGIDPGKTGGIAFMDKGRNVKAYPLPMEGSRIAVGALQTMVMEAFYLDWDGVTLTDSPWAIVYIEQQFIRGPKSGSILIGANYGRIMAILELLEMHVVEVHNMTWRGILPKAIKSESDKDRAIRHCLECEYDIPTLRPRGSKLHDGVADAICIALYGWECIENSE